MFTEEQRRIFQYHNGSGEVWGDPLPIGRHMRQQLGGDPNEALKDARSEDVAVRDAATERLVQAVRVAFDMVPFDKATGTGADEAICLAALDRFLTWNEDQKKSAVSSPKPARSTGGWADAPTTPPGTPSGSASLPNCGCP